jgi:hypothetical protein
MPPTRRDTHLRTLMSCGRTPRLVRPAILSRAPRVPVLPGTHGEPRTLTVRISLTVHRRTSPLTDRYGPLLCKAVLPPLSGAKSASAAQPKQTCRRRHAEADLRDSRHQRQAQPRSGWLSVASHRPPHAAPRGHACQSRPAVGRGAVPRGAAWSSHHRSPGCHTAPSVQDL